MLLQGIGLILRVIALQIQGSSISHQCALSNHEEQHALANSGQGQVPKIAKEHVLEYIDIYVYNRASFSVRT